MGQSYNSKVKLVSGVPAKVGNIMNVLLILQKIKNLIIFIFILKISFWLQWGL